MAGQLGTNAREILAQQEALRGGRNPDPGVHATTQLILAMADAIDELREKKDR